MSGRRRNNPRTVAARVLAILGSFSPEHSELSLVEITRLSGLASSTAHRLVGELHAWGALERDDHLRYRIGARLRELAGPACAVSDRAARLTTGHDSAPALRRRRRVVSGAGSS